MRQQGRKTRHSSSLERILAISCIYCMCPVYAFVSSPRTISRGGRCSWKSSNHELVVREGAGQLEPYSNHFVGSWRDGGRRDSARFLPIPDRCHNAPVTGRRRPRGITHILGLCSSTTPSTRADGSPNEDPAYAGLGGGGQKATVMAPTEVDLSLAGEDGDDPIGDDEGEEVLGVDEEDDEDEEEEEEEGEDEEDDDEDDASLISTGTGGQMLDVEKILARTELVEPSSYSEDFRTGFVCIVGSPNVGKSTLMNHMIGDRLSIVTPKAGTTRHRIAGITTGEDFQLIYQDTPGVLTPAYMLHEGMMSAVREAMGDADATLLVTDIFETEFSTPEVLERLVRLGGPIVVAVNKVDMLPSDGKDGVGEAREGCLGVAKRKEVGSLEDVLGRWRVCIPGAKVMPISALEGINTDELAEELKRHMPVGPPLFSRDVMSDRPQRFFAAEIIREQIFACYSQEIPYSCEVLVHKFKERQSETVLDASIVVSQESQKGIVIGKGGSKIKEVGIRARNALEDHLQTRVNLRLNVKVDKNWRKNKDSLKSYGYLI